MPATSQVYHKHTIMHIAGRYYSAALLHISYLSMSQTYLSPNSNIKMSTFLWNNFTQFNLF